MFLSRPLYQSTLTYFVQYNLLLCISFTISQNFKNVFVPHATYTVMRESLCQFFRPYWCHFGTHKKNDSVPQQQRKARIFNSKTGEELGRHFSTEDIRTVKGHLRRGSILPATR